MFIIALVQMALHYLGILGIILGVITFVFGNSSRGMELLVGGISLIVLKYVIGFVYLILRGLFGAKEK